jgi:hypothetical protein
LVFSQEGDGDGREWMGATYPFLVFFDVWVRNEFAVVRMGGMGALPAQGSGLER